MANILQSPLPEYIMAVESENKQMRAALEQLHSFVAVMVGRGPDAVIPETIRTPIGAPVKIGEIMRAAEAALLITSQKCGEK